MKLSHGFTRATPTIVMFCLYGLSLAALTVGVKHIDISVAYAVWSGLGTALIAVIGVFVFHEPMTALKTASLFLIVAGVVGLNVTLRH